MMIDEYTLIQIIGKGAFGEVYLTSKEGSTKLFATKKVSKQKADSPSIKKYFLNEIIDTLEKYPTDEEVEYSEDINIDSLDTDNLKFSEIINILPEVLRTVKRIEGMPEEQIDEYIDDAMNIIIKYRFEIIRTAPKF